MTAEERQREMREGIARIMARRDTAATLCKIIAEVAAHTPRIVQHEVAAVVAMDLSTVEVSRNVMLLELAVLEHAVPQIMAAMRQHLTEGGDIVELADIADALGRVKH